MEDVMIVMFGFESIFQLFVTATCRKFFSGRAVDEDLFHLFQFISIFVCFRGGSIPGDLWVCQRWKRFGWSTVLRSWCSCHGIDVQKVALRDAEGEQQKSPTVHGCFDASCLAHTIVLVSWSRIEDSGLVFFITRNGSSKFVVFEKNYCIMYGRWNLFQGWNFLQTSSGQQKCICFRNHKPSRWGVGAWSLGGFMAYARAPDFALKIGPWLGAPGCWVLTDIFGASVLCEGVSKAESWRVQIQRPKVLILIEDLPRHRKWKR